MAWTYRICISWFFLIKIFFCKIFELYVGMCFSIKSWLTEFDFKLINNLLNNSKYVCSLTFYQVLISIKKKWFHILMIQFQKVVSDVNLVLPDLCYGKFKFYQVWGQFGCIDYKCHVGGIYTFGRSFFFFLTFPVGF